GPRPARRADSRISAAVPLQRRDLPVLRHRRRRSTGDDRALDAATGPPVLAGVSADEQVLRQQYPDREHAALAGGDHPGLALDPSGLFRARRFFIAAPASAGLAAIPGGGGHWWP